MVTFGDAEMVCGRLAETFRPLMFRATNSDWLVPLFRLETGQYLTDVTIDRLEPGLAIAADGVMLNGAISALVR
jgi:hypothetical protein